MINTYYDRDLHINYLVRDLPIQVVNQILRWVYDGRLTPKEAEFVVRYEWMHEQYRLLLRTPLWFWEA